MKEYKGYIIEHITKRDWVIKKQDGTWDGILNGTKPGTTYKNIAETLKEAKARIDALDR